ncbi:MAG: transglutaminase-like domain-containing protein [Oleiphilaceae bacterium]|nr:transglutaminase-like domain-containing protein [Oleiphilaceae bacterium]
METQEADKEQPMEHYLDANEYIDWRDPLILARARRLSRGLTDETVIAAACFRYVRDAIRHSRDHGLNPEPCRASEVLQEGCGLSFGKSHLLAALLRANELPAGLCYQRLLRQRPGHYRLHGLNAVWLKGHGWYRMDPRGRRPDLRSEFSPPVERLPYQPRREGEYDLPGVYAYPLPLVTETQHSGQSLEASP